MNNNNKKSRKNLFRLAMLAGIIFCMAAGGWLLWLSRPAPAVLVLPWDTGRGILIASGAVPLYVEDEAPDLPLLVRLLSRLLPSRTRSALVPTPGAAPSPLEWKPDADRAVALTPVWVAGGRLLWAEAPGIVKLFDPRGGRVSEWRRPGHEARALTVSRDGRFIAWSTMSRGPERRGFHLYISDEKLTRAIEADITDIYPRLVPGALEWGKDGSLYFSGYVRGNHKSSASYKVDPATGAATQSGPDLGAMFAISPDGANAASVGRYGLSITDMATGMRRIYTQPAPVDSTKPAWSPDGRSVAFVLDVRPAKAGAPAAVREAVAAGPRVALADAATGQVTRISAPVAGFLCRVCQPVWTPDQKHIFVNGVDFSRRANRIWSRNRTALAFDTATGQITFPDAEEIAKMWK